MSNKKFLSPGEVFRTFSHKTKINPGNVNDDELMKDIEEITQKFSFKNDGNEAVPFIQKTVRPDDLREDETGVMNDDWLKGANETKDNFVCVSIIVDEKDV